MQAEKFRLALTVGLVAVAALATSAAGIARVNQDDGNASQFRFVGDELAELAERPAGVPSPLLLPNRCPFADASQVLEADAAPGALGGSDDLFTDAVVLVSAEEGFLSSGAAETLLSSAGAGGFQPAPLALVLPPGALNSGACEYLRVTAGGEIGDAEIDAYEVSRANSLRLDTLDDDLQVERPVTQDKPRVASLESYEPVFLPLACRKFNFRTAGKGQKAHASRLPERQCAAVVSDSAEGFENRLGGFVAGENSAGFCDGAGSRLTGKAEPLANVSIAAPMQRAACELAGCEALFGGVVRPGVERQHVLAEGRELLWRRQKFHSHREAHVSILPRGEA